MDTPSFGLALKNALRQDPDIILLGEMRDLETISTVMLAADTGHLVLSTLHTNNALQTISRILNVFPPEQQDQVRLQLGNVLVGIVSQRLVPRKDGQGRIAAVEVLINTPRIKTLIIENKVNSITEQMEKAVVYERMQSLEQSLVALIANKVISLDVALAASIRPGDLRLMLSQLGFDEEGTYTPAMPVESDRAEAFLEEEETTLESDHAVDKNVNGGAAKQTAEIGPETGGPTVDCGDFGGMDLFDYTE